MNNRSNRTDGARGDRIGQSGNRATQMDPFRGGGRRR
jgi:hypothetical protein